MRAPVAPSSEKLAPKNRVHGGKRSFVHYSFELKCLFAQARKTKFAQRTFVLLSLCCKRARTLTFLGRTLQSACQTEPLVVTRPRFMLRFASLFLVLLALMPQLHAQSKPASKSQFTYSAPKIIGRAGGIRLEGTAANPARINSPQLSVVAPVIAFDLANNTVSQVRAQGGVSLKVSRPATANSPKTYVESRSQSATLTSQTNNRTLQLSGNVSGFYQIGDAPRATLSGENASLNFAGNDFSADLQNPLIVVPPEAIGRVDSLGELRISAQRGQISQGSGTATFSGNARATTSGGANPFDLSAPTFIVLRAADGALSTLSTRGKTVVKYDLPPDPTGTQPSAGSIGKPTHVEVSSDGAVFDRASSKATFAGNVRGFYRLQSASGTRDFPFSGERAVISFDPKAASTQSGLNVEVTGGPVSIDAPAFEF